MRGSDTFNQEQYRVAIKTYSLKSGEESDATVIDLILGEIKFLRMLKACENIVTLKKVYVRRERSEATGEHSTFISLVMNYAKDGSVLKHLYK